ncbi:hypothetical protein CDAR_484941 [Caerostris darwini]|uniref:Uncharacterized protein n=1 Tax=Caerostris darwini TaxID=1538125 RepID=A0AAV4PG58_9ARAC|nr:hypothetical protein CDAR_484941 [Caerostris darwini]
MKSTRFSVELPKTNIWFQLIERVFRDGYENLVNNRECIFLSLQLDDDILFPKAPALSRSKLTWELSASDINLGRAVLIYWFIAAEPKWQLCKRD